MALLNYTVLIRCAPTDGNLAHTALQFTMAVLQSKHKLDTVFFYQRGVLTANGLGVVPQDEVNITHQWQQLAAHYNVQLNVCIAAALFQGVIDQQEAQRYQLDHYNLADGFNLVGLGQLASATNSCDRIISFGNS
jgi:tRNA 2-thiouridine synthesizing protein D